MIEIGLVSVYAVLSSLCTLLIRNLLRLALLFSSAALAPLGHTYLILCFTGEPALDIGKGV